MPDSEQQDHLELADEPAVDDPPSWVVDDPDLAEVTGTDPGEQLTRADDGERTEIAEERGTAYPAGPESAAVRVDEES